MRRFEFDIETNGLDDATVVHCIWIKDADTGKTFDFADQPGRGGITAGLQLLDTADVLIGHNILTYDLPTLRRLTGFQPREGVMIRDTLVCSRLIWTDLENEDYRRIERGSSYPPALIGDHKLKAWGYRLGVLKGVFADTADWKQWTPEMHAYCGQDVEVTHALWQLIERQNYSEQSIQLEHDFRWVIHLQEKHGFRFDKAAAAALQVELTGKRDALLTALRDTFPSKWEEMRTPEYYEYVGPFDGQSRRASTKGDLKKLLKVEGFKSFDQFIQPGPNKRREIPFNPGSRDQVAERLKEKGWTPSKLTDTGKPAVDDESLAKITFPEGRLIRDYFVLDKRLGQVAIGDKSWLKLERNGRIHGAVITNGAVTGRCTHFGPNVAAVPKVQVGRDKHPVKGFDGGYGWECRSMFLADDGMVLVGWDASGLELRCLSHYMARYDGGEYGRVLLEGDIHSVNQKAAGLDTRDKAKTFIYAYLYGAGDELIGENAGGATADEIAAYRKSHARAWAYYVKRLKKQNRVITDQVVGNCVKGSLLRAQFEKGTPALASLKEDIAKAVAAKGYLLGLDGRKLHVRSAHAALNTLLQSCGAILVKMATVILYRKLIALGWLHGREWAQHAHVHDEVQSSTRPELADAYGTAALASIREAGEAFNFRIRLDGEYKIGKTWASTH